MCLHIILLLLVIIWGSINCNASPSRPILYFPNITFFNENITAPLNALPLRENDTAVFLLTLEPGDGFLEQNGTIIETNSPIGNINNLTYNAYHLYEFSSIANGEALNETGKCRDYDFAYDSFKVSVAIILAEGNFTLLDNLDVFVCLEDAPNPPLAIKKIVVTTGTDTTFTLEASDLDDRYGMIDELWSTFSFYSGPDLSLSSGSGFKFNKTTFSFGEIRYASCVGVLDVDELYYSTEFCIHVTDENHVDGREVIKFRAVDSFGMESDEQDLVISLRDVRVCLEGECVLSVEENQNNDDAKYIPVILFSELQGFTELEYELKIETLPEYGELFLLENEQLLPIGNNTRFPPNETAMIAYVPNPKYYNLLFFPEYGPDGFESFNKSDGYGLNECVDVINGCLDAFQYRAYWNNYSRTSEHVGEIKFKVYRTIIEEIRACPTNVGFEFTCRSTSEGSDPIQLYLAGYDGREDPDYKIEIIEPPRFGFLRHYDQIRGESGNEWMEGDLIRPLMGYLPNLWYHPENNFYNRIRYNVNPGYYDSKVDEYGLGVGSCNNGNDCEEQIVFKVISGLNASHQSENYVFEISVPESANENLTVCHVDGFSPWNVSCVSYGYESNELYGTYFTPIYLNVQFVGGSTGCTFRIESLPGNGVLYWNSGNATHVDAGDEVQLYDELPCPDNDDYDYPQLVYEPDENYFNVITYETRNELSMEDENGKQLGNCTNVKGSLGGCPEQFTYTARTDDGRTSNPGIYSIYVNGLPSESELDGPVSILYMPGEMYRFKHNSSIKYTNYDYDTHKVWVQITVYNSLVGVTGMSLENLTFTSTTYSCFNTTGCYNLTEFYAYPSDVQKVFNNLFFTFVDRVVPWIDPSESSDEDDGEYIYISIISKFPDGVTPENAFVENEEDDMVVILDIEYVSALGIPEEDYYFEPDPAGVDGPILPPPVDVNSEEFVEEKAAVENKYKEQIDAFFRIAIFIAICLGVILILGLIAFIIYQYRKFKKSRLYWLLGRLCTCGRNVAGKGMKLFGAGASVRYSAMKQQKNPKVAPINTPQSGRTSFTNAFQRKFKPVKDQKGNTVF